MRLSASRLIESVAQPVFDNVDDARRRNMAAIAGKNTKPEMLVRRLAHRLGYRYRLHAKELPGRPDMVFSGRRKIIEVRGCFWHRHSGCPDATTPRTRAEFWDAKFRATIARDIRNMASLEASGWEIMVVWECETASPSLESKLKKFLGRPVNGLATEACYPQIGISANRALVS